MVEFGGWELPQQYGSVRDEHLAVRQRAGLFDLSHMGRLEVRGPRAGDYLQRLLTNDVTRLEPGHAQYTLLCREDGGILDDLVVYRVGEDDFKVVVNASNRLKDLAWMHDHAPPGIELRDRTGEVSLLALQGPRAGDVLRVLDFDIDALTHFGFTEERALAGVPVLISRTGYTGEDGVEVFVSAERADQVWDGILAAGRGLGVTPCGLGARDACRLEAALRLYGHDIDESTNAYEVGLGWVVKLGKGEFVGRDALTVVKEAGPRRETIGLNCDGRAIPRHGCPVHVDGRRIGAVSSGTFSLWLKRGIAMAMVERGAVVPGEAVSVEVRGAPQPAHATPLPFYRGSVRPAPAAKGA